MKNSSRYRDFWEGLSNSFGVSLHKLFHKSMSKSYFIRLTGIGGCFILLCIIGIAALAQVDSVKQVFDILVEEPAAFLGVFVVCQVVVIAVMAVLWLNREKRFKSWVRQLEGELSQAAPMTGGAKFSSKAKAPMNVAWCEDAVIQAICKEFEYLKSALADKTEREKSLKRALDHVRKEVDGVVKERTLQLEAALEEVEAKMEDSKAQIVALEESEKRFSRLVGSTALGVCMLNSQGEIEWVNDALCQIMSMRELDLQGKKVFDLLEACEVENAIGETSQELQRFVLKVWNKKKLDKHVEGAGSSFVDGSGKEMEVWFFVDATTKVKAEQVLRKSLQEVTENGEIRDRFAKMMAHDVRTPLNVILVASSMIKEDGPGPDSEEAYREVQCSVEHISHLMEDLLFVGQWTSDKRRLKLEKVDLREFCTDAVRSVRIYYLDSHEITVDVDEYIEDFYTDAMLLRRIVVNLLTNAVKYSADRPGVALTIRQCDDRLLIEIKDRGVGIPEDEIGKVFETFYRGSNISRITGRGLGLSIVKESVVLLDGTIDCLSKVNEGTTFRVELPIKVAACVR